MCDCGKRIEDTIKSIKKDKELLKIAKERGWDDVKKETRWYINFEKKMLKYIELNHRMSCLGEMHLILELDRVAKTFPTK